MGLGRGTVGSTQAQGGSSAGRATRRRRASCAAPAEPLPTRASSTAAAPSITEFPFQVALYDPRAGTPAKGFFCGGVILDATHVATAAHCLFGEGGTHTPLG